MKIVVAALIKKDGRYLLAKRSTGNPEMIGLWEFPGGKVEDGETDEEALKREIIEELNTVIKVGARKAVAKINEDTELRLYECTHNMGPYRSKDHSEIVWLDDLREAYKYQLAPADMELLEQIKPLKKRPRLGELVEGQSYTNDDLVRIFCVDNSKGIRYSDVANCLVLISKNDGKNTYEDKWDRTTGIFRYTGQGKYGDQDINYLNNPKLANSRTNGLDLYLFIAPESNDYIYQGQVMLVNEPKYEVQKDENGKDRKVWVFELKKKD